MFLVNNVANWSHVAGYLENNKTCNTTTSTANRDWKQKREKEKEREKTVKSIKTVMVMLPR